MSAIEQRDTEMEPERCTAGTLHLARLHYSRQTASGGPRRRGNASPARLNPAPNLQLPPDHPTMFDPIGRRSNLILQHRARLLTWCLWFCTFPLIRSACVWPDSEEPLRGSLAEDSGGHQLHLPDGRQEVCCQDPLRPQS